MALFMSGEEFDLARKEMEQQARRWSASRLPEAPTPEPLWLSLNEGMAERDWPRSASRPPEDPTPGSSYRTNERILAQVGELELQSQLGLLQGLAALVRREAGKDIIRSIS